MGRFDAAAVRRARPWTAPGSARVDALAFDALVRWTRLPGAPAAFRLEPDIAIVGVDAASLHAIGATRLADRRTCEALSAALAGIASGRPRRTRSPAPGRIGRLLNAPTQKL